MEVSYTESLAFRKYESGLRLDKATDVRHFQLRVYDFPSLLVKATINHALFVIFSIEVFNLGLASGEFVDWHPS
jgi:hypothetical protein